MPLSWSSILVGETPLLILVPFAIVAVVAFAAIAYFVISFFPLWLQATMANAGVGLADIAGMYLRRKRGRPHHYGLVTRCRIETVVAGVPVPLAALEAHHLAGGNVEKVVHAVIVRHREGAPIGFDEAAALDLAGQDLS